MLTGKDVFIASMLAVAGLVIACGSSDCVSCDSHDFKSESGSHGGSSIQRFGACGVMAQITVSVSASNVVTVTGGGSAGGHCIWSGMEVQVQLRNATTGVWENKPGYDDGGTTWKGKFDETGYDKYRAKTASLDSLVGNIEEEAHRVTTGWLSGSI